MAVIIKRETNLGTIYEKINSNGDLIQQAGVMGFVTKDEDERTYFILVNWNGSRIKEGNRYLNVKLAGEAYKKRESAFTALKHFYSFVRLFNIKDYEKGLNDAQVEALKMFLKGGKRKATIWDIELDPIRANITVNKYLSVYRDFYKKIFKITDSPLHSTHVVSEEINQGDKGRTNLKAVDKYDSNLRVKIDDDFPEHITYEQYQMIMELAEAKYTLREKFIMMLMYKYGLRLGEVLGLTFEDFERTRTGYRLIIRNRFTDKPYQSAKSLMKIKSRADYKDPDYKKKGNGFGYQIVDISTEMGLLIQDYIDETRDEFLLSKSKKKSLNLEEKTRADKVTDYEGANYYIILNRGHYTPLTAKGWGDILKEIFDRVGIKADEGTRKNGLSHLFRHGFAIFKVYEEGNDALKLADALRHSGTHSVMKYFKPTAKERACSLRKQRERQKRGGISFE